MLDTTAPLYLAATYSPQTDAVGGSVLWSAILGVIPLVAFFVFLIVFKWAAHISAIAATITALAVAIFAFGMPVSLTFNSLIMGMAFGLFPIVFIIIMAVWIYDLTVKSGRFEDLRVIFSAIGKGDMRVQALIIAFTFGGILEGLAGFGAPVAIVVSMLVAIGMKPMRAIFAGLIANAAPVAFGAMAIPITTAASLTNLDPTVVAATAGRQLSILALVTPFVLCIVMDGMRGLRQVWPMALVLGVCFGGGQFLASNFFAYELTDVVACLIALAGGIGFLRFWTPTTPEEQSSQINTENIKLQGGASALALFPYGLIVVVFAITKVWTWGVDIPAALKSTDIAFGWPGLHGNLLTSAGEVSNSPTFNFNWLSNPGTILFFCGVITALVYTMTSTSKRPMKMGMAFAELGVGVNKMKLSYLTIMTVMGLAYVMNFSGQTAAIGALLAGAGVVFPLLSPILGWLGTAVTGSATSSMALFAQMQSSAATSIGVDPHLLVAANSAGAVTGKMISPQTVTLAAASAGIAGSESKITSKIFVYSLGLLALMCALVMLQSTVLNFMVP